MIFLGRVELTLVVESQWLATDKTHKKRKNAKKSVKHFAGYL
jgi:hypothetical protein